MRVGGQVEELSWRYVCIYEMLTDLLPTPYLYNLRTAFGVTELLFGATILVHHQLTGLLTPTLNPEP